MFWDLGERALHDRPAGDHAVAQHTGADHAGADAVRFRGVTIEFPLAKSV